jgi:hypothetical protein
MSVLSSLETSSSSSCRKKHIVGKPNMSFGLWFQFAKWFQRRRLKSKRLQTTDAKNWSESNMSHIIANKNVFKATFNNISVISWLCCFIGGVYRENHWPVASLTNFIHNVVSSNKQRMPRIEVKAICHT